TVLAGVLKKFGYEVVETTNGAAAWMALHQPDAPSLVILDWMMPEMDGVEVVRRVRATPTDRAPYLILLTTRGAKADLAAGREAGADDYITKPFDSSELRARVEVGRRVIDLQDALAAKVGELREALDEIEMLREIVAKGAKSTDSSGRPPSFGAGLE
ncbi:MAG: response regulator transcription factor, partial [Bryobacterales bacterium]|nr:response regulator transcription factor [Bryobacterales bacterium]